MPNINTNVQLQQEGVGWITIFRCTSEWPATLTCNQCNRCNRCNRTAVSVATTLWMDDPVQFPPDPHIIFFVTTTDAPRNRVLFVGSSRRFFSFKRRLDQVWNQSNISTVNYGPKGKVIGLKPDDKQPRGSEVNNTWTYSFTLPCTITTWSLNKHRDYCNGLRRLS